MSETQFVRYVGPHDSVDVVLAGDLGHWWTVAQGETVEVPAAAAGRPPTPASGEPGTDGYVPADPGAGLLAQTTNWEPVSQREGRKAVNAPADPPVTDTADESAAERGSDTEGQEQ